MRPEISEFSFGFAFTSELVHHYDAVLAGAPRFPTQAEEGHVGGYDVELPRPGHPFFLQFKRSECLTRRSALEARSLGLPYYRMHLHPSRFSDQHQLLLELEQSGHEVYYVAPRFHTAAELNDAYLTNGICERSVLVKPSQVGPLPDDRNHHLSVSADGARWEFHSGPGRIIPSVPTRRVLTVLAEVAASRGRRYQREDFQRLGETLIRVYSDSRRRPTAGDTGLWGAAAGALKNAEEGRKLIERAERLRLERSPAESAQETAQRLFGCELMFALAPARTGGAG